jgi:alpha-tubulin suppressor-like RCC1 family protein
VHPRLRSTACLLLAGSALISCGGEAPTGVRRPRAVKLAFSMQPASSTAGAAIGPIVQVVAQDGAGATVRRFTGSVTLALGVNPGTGVLAGTATVAAVNGIAAFSTLRINRTGSGYTLTAAATGLATATSIPFDVTPGAAGRLLFAVQPATAAAGSALNPSLRVVAEDASGNVATTFAGNVSISIGTNPSAGVLSGTATVAAVDGAATFSDLSINRAATGYTLLAGGAELASVASNPFAVTPGAAARLSFTVEPTVSAAGFQISPVVEVTVHDAFGNVATAATTPVTVAIQANPGGGALSGLLATAPAQGIAAFTDLRISKLGIGYTLAASAPGLSGAISAAFTIKRAYASLSTFSEHTCGLETGGTLYCWGLNQSGQLGTDDGVTFYPAAVSPLGGLTFTAMSVGGYHTCGLATSGAAYCWGDGPATGDTLPDTPPPIGKFCCRTAPWPVASGSVRFVSLAAGAYHTCGLTALGAAYCWGVNRVGSVGDGTRIDRYTPVPVSGGLTFVSLSVGAHACGLTASGAAYCWGWNAFGELGDGTTTDRLTPVPVAGGLTFSMLSSSINHMCGITRAGAAYCWGWNALGQLGDGTTTNRSTPVPVSGGLTFVAVTAGYGGYSCALTTAGVAYCWGDNRQGQLGDGTTAVHTTPVAVAGNIKFTSVSLAWLHACGISNRGLSYCWGRGSYLGDGNPTGTRLTPVLVAP